MPAIVTRALTKVYGRSAPAVDRMDITVERGEVYGLLGRNGAGKTTLMAMLLGLVRPTGGTFDVLGRPAGHRGADARVGALIEAPAFYPFLTGRQNLEVLARYATVPVAAVAEALARVGLEAAADRRYRQYSLGMKQRLGIAGAILGSPQLVVLDEPTNGLDPQAVHEVRELIRSLRDEGATVLLSSHVLSEVEQVVDRVAVIAAGRLVEQDTIQALRARSSVAPVVVVRTPDVPGLTAVAGRLPAVRDVRPVSDDTVELVTDEQGAASLNADLLTAGATVHELTVRTTSLEQVFLQLTADEAEVPA